MKPKISEGGAGMEIEESGKNGGKWVKSFLFTKLPEKYGTTIRVVGIKRGSNGLTPSYVIIFVDKNQCLSGQALPISEF